MNKKIISAAGILGMLAIVLGAFGAHGLKKFLTVDQIATFETGVRYQMYHALFLLFVGTTALIEDKIKKRIYFLTLCGVVFFSGSIYLLATNSYLPFDFKPFGLITPIGGLFLILAWFILVFDLFLSSKKEK